MKIANVLEQRTLDVLCSLFKLPIINFNGYTYKEYIARRKRTSMGFIGYQVPRKGVDRIYRNDFVVFTPNGFDHRIECKSLDSGDTLARAVITEEKLIAETMPENKLVLLAVGKGFSGDEFNKTFNKTKNDKTILIKNIETLVKYFN